MTTKQPINETDHKDLIASWFTEAETFSSIDNLPGFLRRLLNDYAHDYGTICHALAAGAIAAANAMNRNGGGITGFQAGAVMWEFIRHWEIDTDGPMRLVRFRNMLYPQYADRFAPVLSADTWADLQSEAKRLLTEKGLVHPDVRAHWQSVAAGTVPFGWAVRQ